MSDRSEPKAWLFGAGGDLSGFLTSDPEKIAYVLPGSPVPDGSPQITLGIMDSGVNANHPQLAGRVVEAVSFTAAPPADSNGHGTAVAIIAAVEGNTSILSARVTDADNIPDVEAVLKAIDWFSRTPVRVVNMSFGFDTDLPGADRICAAIAANPRISFVAAKSNRRGGRHPVFPASCTASNVIAVGTPGMDTADGSINAQTLPFGDRTALQTRMTQLMQGSGPDRPA